MIQTYVTEKVEYVMLTSLDVNKAILAMIVGNVTWNLVMVTVLMESVILAFLVSMTLMYLMVGQIVKVGIFNKFKVHWMFNKSFIKT